MKIVKRIAIIVGVLLVLLLGAAVLVPILFKDRLMTLAKEQINQNVNAVVEFEDVNLSLLRDFPDISFAIENYSVTGKGQFEGVQLASGELAGLTLDLFSVLSSSRPVELTAVQLEKPNLQIYVLRNGAANYDIALESEAEEVDTATEESSFEIRLESYLINDGRLLYDDHSAETYALIEGLVHSGSGNFTSQVFDLITKTTIRRLTLRQNDITYLNEAEAALDATLNIDQAESKYTLKDNLLTLNAFQVKGDGFVQLDGENYNMDLHLEAPENEFKNLLSLIPNAYIEGYEEVEASGQFRFVSDIKGTYSEQPEQYPSFSVMLEVQNGEVQYPGFPLSIRRINTEASINSPGSNLDDMIINVPAFSMYVGENPIEASLHLQNPISDPDINASVDGVLDLQQLSQAYPIEGAETLAGIIRADIEVETRLSSIEQERYEQVRMDGRLSVENLLYETEEMPAIKIAESQVDFTPQRVNIISFDAQLGNSDLQGSGAIDNILAYISPEKTMTGELTLRSEYFDANEWYTQEEEAESATLRDTTSNVETEAVFDRFNFAVDARADKILYEDYQLTNTYARGQITPNRMEVSEAFTLLGDSDFRASGLITNVFDYLYEEGVLRGQLDIRSQQINLNQFMEEEETVAEDSPSGEETSSAIPVPPNIDMRINVRANRVIYTNLTLNDVSGALSIADQAAVLEQVSSNALGGALGLQGAYDTSDPDNPAFNIKFDMSSMNFQEAFSAFNTFQALAPIGQFIQGSFNSSLILDGTLTEELMPRLNTLDAKGFLETANAVVNNFKPLQSIGQKLNASFLTEKWQLNDLRAYFEVQDGQVEVKPFDVKVENIPMTISGAHGIDTNMDYDIQASIPRELLRKSNIGQAADTGLSFLQKQASQLGIDFQQGEYVNVMINLAGTIKQPNVGLKLLGTGGEGSIAEQAEGTLKEEAQKQIEAGKKQLEDKGQELLDTAKTVVEKQVEEAKKQAGETLRKEGEKAAEQLGEETKKKAEEVLDTTATKAVDNIKNELEKWNPFKKKKKETPPPTKQDTTKTDTTKSKSGQ